MTKDQEHLLIERMNAQCSFAMFSPDRTSIEIEPLPFYKHFRLLKATTFSTIPPVTMHYLIDEDNRVVKMDGTRDPILANNARGGLILNEQTVVSYARFILDAVQSDQGTIRLVEHFDRDEMITGQPTDEQLAILQEAIRPTRLVKTGDGFMLDAIILYGDAVFRADIQVKPDGYVEFLHEDSIADRLPIRPIFLE